MRIDHIGYAVRTLAEAARKFELLGYHPCSNPVEDPERKVKIQFYVNASGVKVELITPLQDGSPVDAWLQKNGSAPYHICYQSDELEADVSRLKDNGFMVLHPASPAPAMEGRRVVFTDLCIVVML